MLVCFTSKWFNLCGAGYGHPSWRNLLTELEMCSDILPGEYFIINICLILDGVDFSKGESLEQRKLKSFIRNVLKVLENQNVNGSS